MISFEEILVHSALCVFNFPLGVVVVGGWVGGVFTVMGSVLA